MRRSRSVPALLVLLASGTVVAQTNDFDVYPNHFALCTTGSSRCALGAGAGELLAEYPMGGMDTAGNTNDFFRGIGQTGPGTCRVRQFNVTIADQQCATREGFFVVVRGLAASGVGPDPVVPLFRGGPLSLPVQSGACAFDVRLTLATPISIPCAQSFFFGVEIPANAAWPADGLALQYADYTLGVRGDVPRAAAGKLHWQVAAGVASQCASDWLWDVGLGVECPTLNVGNLFVPSARCGLSPAWGAGGLWPDNCARGDGVALRVQAAAYPSASVAAFLSFSPAAFELPIPGVLGCASLWIGPTPFVQIATGTTNGSGTATLTPAVLGRNALAAYCPGPLDLWFQAVVAAPALPLPMTNAAKTRLGTLQ